MRRKWLKGAVIFVPVILSLTSRIVTISMGAQSLDISRVWDEFPVFQVLFIFFCFALEHGAFRCTKTLKSSRNSEHRIAENLGNIFNYAYVLSTSLPWRAPLPCDNFPLEYVAYKFPIAISISTKVGSFSFSPPNSFYPLHRCSNGSSSTKTTGSVTCIVASGCGGQAGWKWGKIFVQPSFFCG